MVTSRRDRVAFPVVALSALKRHLKARIEERLSLVGSWSDRGMVFPSRTGNPVYQQDLIVRSFKPLLRRAGLPDIRFHDFRHTCAPLLLAKGVHAKYVQELLGHATISITLDIYSHVLPGMGGAASGAMVEALG